MIKNNLLIIVCFISSQIFVGSVAMKSFAISASVCGSLPSAVHEASGLDYTGGSHFWTHNDNWYNKLYKVSTTGALAQTITITGATNDNWEDITHDKSRTYMYIGDFGNNFFDRHNLKIYRIPYPSSSTTTVAASAIKFTYPDQHQFPAKWKNFDVEAFYHSNGKLYLFTKGDGNATGYTKLYTVPDSPGSYTASLIDSFQVNGRITGAAISPNGKTVVLISNTKVYMFRNFSGTNIFNGNCTKITINGSWTQKEGVSFYSDTKIYIVDEGSSNKLYSINLASYITSPRLSAPEVISEPVATASFYPNPASTFAFIQTNEVYNHVDIVIANMSGQIVREISIDNPEEKIQIDTEILPVGNYAVRIIGDNRKQMNVLFSVIR